MQRTGKGWIRRYCNSGKGGSPITPATAAAAQLRPATERSDLIALVMGRHVARVTHVKTKKLMTGTTTYTHRKDLITGVNISATAAFPSGVRCRSVMKYKGVSVAD